MRDILWEGIDEGKDSHHERWEVVLKLLDLKGLGIGNVRVETRPCLLNGCGITVMNLTSYDTRS